MGRERLETGTSGSVGTGDTIHDGGNKLNNNSDEFYHVNADFEMTDSTEAYIPVQGDTSPRPHAGGYFNRIPPSSTAGGTGGANDTPLNNNIITGGKYDIDTTAGVLTLNLPFIGVQAGQAKRGEKVIFQNTTGSLSVNSVIFHPSSGQTIKSTNHTSGDLHVRDNDVMVTFTVTDDGSRNTPQWTFKIEPIGGEYATVSDQVMGPIPSGGDVDIPLFDSESYDAVKFVVYAQNADPAIGGSPSRKQASEILVLNNTNNAYITEYAVVLTDSEFGNLISIVPRVDTSTGYVTINVTSNDDNISVSVKSIETIRV